MFSPDDTIVAIATPPGHGGLGIVRLSGPAAAPIVTRMVGRTRPLSARRATFARIREDTDGDGPRQTIDQVVCTWFPAPRSYTGQDVVEIAAHGSPVVLRGIVQLAIAAGARLAGPGEFTLRAYLNGRLDLVQAEAVADLVNAVTPTQARLACEQLEGVLTRETRDIEAALFAIAVRLEASLDFPDEGYRFLEPHALRDALRDLRARLLKMLSGSARGRVIREGRRVVIVGGANVGKSTLFNALLGFDRAITADAPGTTRDVLAEQTDVLGVPVTFVDTAGIRYAADRVEHEGVKRARNAVASADLTLLVLDRSVRPGDEQRALVADTAGHPRVVARTKADLPSAWDPEAVGLTAGDVVDVSASSGAGLASLRELLVLGLGGAASSREGAALSNVRHIALVEQGVHGVERALEAVEAGASEEFVLVDLREALEALQELTGKRASGELLEAIFSRFCIGK